MKTKNMRKKALLSSVAMLLVAVVALSSATYAWFTANSAATVSGVQLKSTTASSLQFSTTQAGDYSALLDLGVADKTLTPVSSADATAFFVVNADSSTTVGTAGETKIASVTAASDTLYYTTTFYVKAGTNTGIALTAIGAGYFNTALRISLAFNDGTPVIYEAAQSGTVYAVNNTYAGDTAGMTYAEMYKGTTSSVASIQGITAAQNSKAPSATAITGVTLLADVAQKVTMHVWLEGNDPDCVDTMANKTLDNLQLSFALA